MSLVCVNTSFHVSTIFVQIGDIFTLDYVPWGNAKLVDGKFECQHGEMECIVNTIDACLLKYHPDRYVCICVCVWYLFYNRIDNCHLIEGHDQCNVPPFTLLHAFN